MNKEKLKILVFAPHSAIWVHAFPEALIADALAKQGHEIVYITCDRQFHEYCTCMTAHRLVYNSPVALKEKVCKICQTQQKILVNNFGFRHLSIGDFVNQDELVDVDNIIDKVTVNDFHQLVIDNIEIGKIAAYELLIMYKKLDLKLSKEEWSHYLISLKNCLISLCANRKILQQERPDRIIIYGVYYSVSNICRSLAQLQNTPVYFLEAGMNLSNRLETILMGKNSGYDFFNSLKISWQNQYSDTFCTQENLKLVTDHFLELFAGKHFLVYSSPISKNHVSFREKFNIKKEQKVLVATMSSYDERFAGEVINEFSSGCELMFANQLEWIAFIIDFIKHREDLFLLIRIHPREFPNKRDNVKSDHTFLLEKVLTDLPKNVAINYPNDNLSIYNLAEETDLFLNAWSTVGEQMPLLGLPVIIYSSNLVLYPPDLNYCAINREDYLIKIDQALSDGWNFERIRKAYRWHCLKLSICNLNLSDSIFWEKEVTSNNKLTQNTIFTRSYFLKLKLKFLGLKLKIARIFNEYADYASQIKDCQQRSPNPKCQNLVNEIVINNYGSILDVLEAKNDSSSDFSSLEQETKEICVQLKRLMDVLYEQNSSSIQPNTLREKLIKLIK